MNKIFMSLYVLFVLLFTAGLSFAQDAAQNNTVNENVIPAPATNDSNVTSVSNLQYIWSVTGIEPGLVTMVLNQEGKDLHGQAKYEPDSGEAWNAVVAGSIAGDNVDLVIAALVGKELVSTKMSGTFANESLAGNYFRVSEGKITGRGKFDATWINPDTTSYTPAKITQPQQEMPAQMAQNATTTQTAQQPVQLGQKSRFVDVREYKDKIGPAGVIPPGMGGSGLPGR
ncbi:MAG: hypothetical protein LUQ38_05680 [Methanotrichaceae archaeon]|nr:hypothetical protein [Methanotrichaceae archaeon]